MPSFADSLVFSLTALAATSCGGSSSDNPGPLDAPAIIDTPPIDMQPPPDPPPAGKTIEVFPHTLFGEVQEPVFIRYRVGGGLWKAAFKTETAYLLEVDPESDTELVIVAVCGDSTTGFDVGYDARFLPLVANGIFMPCAAPRPSGRTFQVTGAMAQAGTVALGGGRASSTAPNWNFSLDAAAGGSDLVAVGGDRVLIRRGIDVTTPTTLATVDTATGSPLAVVPLTINGAVGSETVATTPLLSTEHALTLLPSSPGTTARTAPSGVLEGSDGHFLCTSAEEGAFGRAVMFDAREPARTYTLPARLRGVQFSSTGATWAGVPVGRGELVFRGGGNTMSFRASADWMRAKLAIAFDTDIPGFLAEWKPALEARELDVERTDQDGSTYLSRVRDGQATTAPTCPRMYTMLMGRPPA